MRTREIRELDYLYFERNAREGDVAECITVSPTISLRDHIRISKEQSIESYAFVDNEDNPIALYGLMQNNNLMVVWLLTTTLVEKHKLSFMKKAKKEVYRFFDKYGILWLITDSRYEQARKLNLWCGFREWGEPVFINDVEFRIYCFEGK